MPGADHRAGRAAADGGPSAPTTWPGSCPSATSGAPVTGSVPLARKPLSSSESGNARWPTSFATILADAASITTRREPSHSRPPMPSSAHGPATSVAPTRRAARSYPPTSSSEPTGPPPPPPLPDPPGSSPLPPSGTACDQDRSHRPRAARCGSPRCGCEPVVSCPSTPRTSTHAPAAQRPVVRLKRRAKLDAERAAAIVDLEARPSRSAARRADATTRPARDHHERLVRLAGSRRCARDSGAGSADRAEAAGRPRDAERLHAALRRARAADLESLAARRASRPRRPAAARIPPLASWTAAVPSSTMPGRERDDARIVTRVFIGAARAPAIVMHRARPTATAFGDGDASGRRRRGRRGGGRHRDDVGVVPGLTR